MPQIAKKIILLHCIKVNFNETSEIFIIFILEIIASQHGHEDVMELLLSNGATQDCLSLDYLTSLDIGNINYFLKVSILFFSVLSCRKKPNRMC